MLKYKRLFRVLLVCLLGVAVYAGCKKDKDTEPVPGNMEAVGASANQLLSDQQFKTLFVEVMSMPGHAPTSESLDQMKDFLNSVVRKPNGIVVQSRNIPSGNQSTYSVQNIRDIEDQHRELFNGPSVMVVSFVFLDGEFAGNSGDSKVLGVAYRNTSMAVYQKTVKENSGGLTQPSRTKLESTIINHELGHLLGLVNNGSPMVNNHIDTENGHHCNKSNCLMYFAVKTTDIIANLITGDIPELDENCRLDLSANGGK